MPDLPEPPGSGILRIAEEIFSQPRYAPRPGLHRMERLISELGESHWWQGLDSIRITGSNGKGTVAALVEAILRQGGPRQSGPRTGLYTSPHLRHFAERFRIEGRPASEAQLAAAMDGLRPALAAPPKPGIDDPPLAFEAMTALALRLFERESVEALVVEAGIGGRFDATRTIPGQLGVLVSVDFEHTSILGSTLEAIAADKAEIVGEGGELIVGRLPPDLLASVRSAAEARGVEVVALDEHIRWTEPCAVEPGPGLVGDRPGLAIDLDQSPGGGPTWKDLRVALAAPHQAENVALAVLVARRWLARHRPEVGDGELEAMVRQALVSVEIEGRFERIREQPEVWIDIGHTPAAARATAEAIRWRFGRAGDAEQARPVLLVAGVSHDKEASAIIDTLAGVADRLICTRANHRGGDVARVAERARRLAVPHEQVGTVEGAVERAVALAERDGARVVVAGGLFLAMEASEALAGRDPRALCFY